MQQAVLDFDEEVLAPWRPSLRSVPPRSGSPFRAAPSVRPAPVRRVAPSRPGAPAAPVTPTRPPAPARPAQRAPVAERARVRARTGRPPRPGVDGFARDGADRVRGSGAPAPAVRAPRVNRPAGAPRPGRLRLTRRARRLLAVLALAAGVVLGSLLGPIVGGGAELRLAGVDSVVVQPGDTLWSIARSAAGDGDVRIVVARIRELNGLTGVDLQPGQVLRLP